MQKLLLFLGVIALLGTSSYLFFHQHRSNGISNETVSLFNEWKQQYQKSYKNSEETYRLAIFSDNLNAINKFNAEESAQQGYAMGMNQFMDLPKEEFRATYLNYIAPKAGENQGIMGSDLPQQNPATVNWVTAGKTPPVLNQGQCGSCYAFSAVESIDSVDGVFGSGVGSFSTQQMVDCTFKQGNLGCNGGNPYACFNYVVANGITTWAAYPYTGVTGKCKTNGGAFKISNYTNIPANNCNALQTAIVRQPISICVDAQTWQFYKSGIFSNCGTSLDHCVLAVGYTSTYWYVQNSWAATWGMNGFIELKYPGNTCGLCQQASYPNL